MKERVRAPFVCQAVSTAAWRRPSRVDPTRTALREAAYILRTRFEWGDSEVVDFTKRRGDLFMSGAIVPSTKREWVDSPFLRWKAADEAAEKTGRADEIRAWHVVADLPEGYSKGEWFDRAEKMVRAALPESVVAEMAGHSPFDGTPPHMHLLVAPRFASDRSGYGRVAFCIYRRLNEQLRASWLGWLA